MSGAARSVPATTDVVCVALAPTIDRAYRVATPRMGEVNRASEVTESLGGNAANVAATLTTAGIGSRLVVPWRGDPRLLPPNAVVVGTERGPRVNTIVVAADGSTTNFNETPRELRHSDWEQLQAETLSALPAAGGGVLVVGGSVPQISETGTPAPVGNLVRAARARGAYVCIDVPGHAIQRVLEAAGGAELVKPNRHELEEYGGGELKTLRDVLRAARAMRTRHNVGVVLASLGQDGLLAVGSNETWARARAFPVVNTTGAGDATVGGYLATAIRRGGPGTDTHLVDEEAARMAASWAALTVQTISPNAVEYAVLPWSTSRRIVLDYRLSPEDVQPERRSSHSADKMSAV